MSERKPEHGIISDASWAHNRWPTIGLYTGAGLGAVMSVVFVPGWMWALGYVIAGAIAGCVLGLGLVKLIYWRQRV